jgi:hypothetical protein
LHLRDDDATTLGLAASQPHRRIAVNAVGNVLQQKIALEKKGPKALPLFGEPQLRLWL